MKKTFILSMLIVAAFVSNAQSTIQKQWELTGFEAPESVIYNSKLKTYYVSNVSGGAGDKDGKGFISTIDETGKLINKEWVTGLNAPKGLGLSGSNLYVSDVDEVVVINIESGKIIERLKAEGAQFLNDITVSKAGDVYVSDMSGNNTIYAIKNGRIEPWLKDEKLNYPNGLLIKGNDLFVATWGTVTNPQTFETPVKGKLISINLENKKIKEISQPIANGDGLTAYQSGFLLTDWVAGKLFFIDAKGSAKEMADLKAGSADIFYVQEKKILVVPQMMEGKLMAFTIK